MSNFFESILVKSNLTEHNLLKTEIGITLSPLPVSVLHLAYTLSPILLSMCLLVACVLWCRLQIFVSVVCCVLLLLCCLLPNVV